MSSKNNDQVILEKIIEGKIAEMDIDISYSDYFEIYSANEILKDYDLSYEDVREGIVGDGGDGGIDSFFLFLNGELIKEDNDINYNQKKNSIELVIIQSKISPSFSEGAIIKFKETAEDLFNLSNSLDSFRSRYNIDLLFKIKSFRELFEGLLKTSPKLSIKYFYVTQGDQVHPNVEGKVEKLRDCITNLFSSADFTFEFIGARRLVEISRDIPSTSRILEVSESPISTESGSYVCLVSLSKYYEFISDRGNLARSIFESNVRDYQGNVIVNTGIKQTLQNPQSENFWYLNNGVTILTPKAVLSGRKLTIEDPQIVNGLQTSHEIYKHFSEMTITETDDRAILTRVICEDDESARDRIIRATNSQTNIPPASLRSSDEIHRDIEDFLKANFYYYDRKKNHYKNQGKAINRIISISYLAQAMMAIVLLKPDSARARPSTLINSNNEYEKLFSRSIPIDIYLKVIQVMKETENYLRPTACKIELERKTVTNIKYYVAMMVGIALAGRRDKIVEAFASIPSIAIEPQILQDSLKLVLDKYNELGASDQVAKGPELVASLLRSM